MEIPHLCRLPTHHMFPQWFPWRTRCPFPCALLPDNGISECLCNAGVQCFRNPSVKVRFLQIPQPLGPLVSTFLTSTLGALALFAAWLCVNVHRKHQSLTWFHCERSTRGSYGPGLCRIKVSVLLMLFFGSFTVLSWLTSGGSQCFCPDTLPVLEILRLKESGLE